MNKKRTVSTITNIFYVVAGVLALIFAESINLTLGVAVGALVYLGVASGMFHWTHDRFWQKLDIHAIVVVFSMTFLHNVWRFGSVGETDAFWLTLLAMLGLSTFVLFVREDIRHLTVGAMGLMTVTHYSAHSAINSVWVWVLFLLAVFMSFVIAGKRHEDSEVYDTAHGTWHVLTASALFLLLI